MKQTQNYQLNQWEKTDRIKMEDFNGDNEKIDVALKTLAGQVASKANSSSRRLSHSATEVIFRPSAVCSNSGRFTGSAWSYIVFGT